MKSFNKPLLLLGGGGYTIRNVALVTPVAPILEHWATLGDSTRLSDALLEPSP